MPLPVTTGRRPLPPRLFLYGPPGIGKTTLAAAMPGVLLFPIEEGSDAIDVPRLPQPKSWTEAMGLLDLVIADPAGFQALAIDSATALEALCQTHVATEQKCNTVEDIPYGKGYPAVVTEWRKFLDRLTAIRAKGVAIVLVGHLSVVRYDDPRTQGYDRFQPRLHKSIMPMMIEWCDALLCATYQVFTASEDKGFNRERTRAVGGGARILYAEERPTHLAKNRYSLPAEMPMSWAPIFEGIGKAFAVPAPAVTEKTEPAAAVAEAVA